MIHKRIIFPNRSPAFAIPCESVPICLTLPVAVKQWKGTVPCIIPESDLLYVPFLRAVLMSIGVSKDGKVIKSDEMQKLLRKGGMTIEDAEKVIRVLIEKKSARPKSKRIRRKIRV